jgi:hypothetical protein
LPSTLNDIVLGVEINANVGTAVYNTSRIKVVLPAFWTYSSSLVSLTDDPRYALLAGNSKQYLYKAPTI